MVYIMILPEKKDRNEKTGLLLFVSDMQCLHSISHFPLFSWCLIGPSERDDKEKVWFGGEGLVES